MKKDIFVILLVSIIWVCKPIPYETVASRKYVHNRTIDVVVSLKGGRSESDTTASFVLSLLNLRKIKKFDPAFHRLLEQRFPDWKERMDYQQKQEKLYESALRKERESKRIRHKPDSLYTNEELDAIKYFKGTGSYAKHQDPKTKPNVFDTKQSFLLKMHDPKLRENFLNSFNCSYG